MMGPSDVASKLLSGSLEAVLLVHAGGDVSYMTEAAQRMFGTSVAAGHGPLGGGIDVSSLLSFRPEAARHESASEQGAALSWADVRERIRVADQGGDAGGQELIATARKMNGGDESNVHVHVTSVFLGDEDCGCLDGNDQECRQRQEPDSGTEHFCAYVRELSPRQDQQRRIKELEEQVQYLSRLKDAVIQASGDVSIVFDENGSIRSVDEAALDQFKYEKGEDLEGRDIRLLIGEHPLEPRGAPKGIDPTSKRRKVTGQRRDGTSFNAGLGVAEVKHDGEPRLFAGMLRRDSMSKISAGGDHDRSTPAGMRRGMSHRDIGKSDQTTNYAYPKWLALYQIPEASLDAMFAINEKGIISLVNQAAVDKFGWSRNDFVGSNISMIVGGNRAQDHDGYIARYLRTGEKRVMGKKRELLARRKNGTEFSIELGLTEIRTELGNERMFCGFIKDLSKQKRYELELTKKQSITAGILEASFDAMFQINERGLITMVNQAAVDQFGWSRDEFMWKNISMIVGGSHTPKHDGYIAQYLKTGKKHVMGKKRELPARRKDGTEFTIELGLSEIKTEQGDERMFCGFIKDLSRQKSDELKLTRKERITRGVLEASFDAMFQISEFGIIQMVNQAAVNQFGWSREEFIGNNISMIVGGTHALKHDEYIARYLQTGEKRVMGKKRELPARRKNGVEFPIELGLTEIRTELGDERLFCGFIKDLSKQKNVELELKKEERITRAILEASFDAMFHINERGVIQMVNQAAVDQFGWSRFEFIGSNISMIVGGNHAQKHDEYISRYLKTGEKRVMGKRRELPARRKDGTEFTIELGLAEIQTDMGDERMFCGFIKDLTLQKDNEQKLERSFESLGGDHDIAGR